MRAGAGARPHYYRAVAAPVVVVTPPSTGGGTTGATGTTTNQGTVPLGAGDMWQSSPIDTSAATVVDVVVTSDQPFSVTLDTSTNGSTFTLGTSYAATLTGGSYVVSRSITAPTAWARLSITCGPTGMTRLSATTTPHS